MHKQVIYFGAPGTGKSHDVDRMVKELGSSTIQFRVTIHPEYTYSDFIGQLLPSKAIGEGDSYFEFRPGPFTKALGEAFSDSNIEVFLILEELSRGNVSAIFGDVFQLLDRNEYFESRYPIHNEDIASYIPELLGDDVYLPSNFNIIGTVNVNDQSVFPMDTAFKRRFDWVYVSSSPAVRKDGIVDGSLNNPMLIVDADEGGLQTNWQSFYSALNTFIVDGDRGLGRNEDRQIGQFFLIFKKQDVINSHSKEPSIQAEASKNIQNQVKNKLLLYLWQDVQSVSAFGSSTTLFSPGIHSFDDLYNGYGICQVFSNVFIDEFLKPNILKYPYGD